MLEREVKKEKGERFYDMTRARHEPACRLFTGKFHSKWQYRSPHSKDGQGGKGASVELSNNYILRPKIPWPVPFDPNTRESHPT